MSNEQLFNEFSPVSTEAWEAVINKDLKGADYEKRLLWRTEEGFNVRPYYRAEDLQNIDYLNNLPNTFPYTRGHKADDNNWNIVEEIAEHDPKKANEIAVKSLAKGATAVTLSAKNVTTYDDLKQLLANIDLNVVGVHFHHAANYVALMDFFLKFIDEKKFDKTKIEGSFDFDAIVHFLKRRKFYKTQAEDLADAVSLITMSDALPKFKVLNINGLAMHNGGATIVQEMGYALAIAAEYLNFITEKGVEVAKVARKMQMTLSIGSNYFMEIAKLRAIRLLWSTMVAQYQPKCDCAYKLVINSVASSWNKTLYDPYVNMLRSTTEGMAAAIGGADAIALKPFDIAYQEADDFSRHLSRNVQIILKEESYFNKVVDPAAGSYYIENLTNSLAEQAWKFFQGVDAAGGVIKEIENGNVQKNIEASCQKRDMDIATRKYILLGTNQYPNANDQMSDKITKTCSCHCEGLKSYRGAMAFEEVRLHTERFAKENGRPKVFLLKIGNLAMRQARAGFATNFFGCAGYEIIDNTGFKTAEEGVKAAAEANANIIVMCSSDEEYATIGIEAAKTAKAQLPNALFVIAGNPTETIDALKAAGTDDFIHVKTNVLNALKKYNETLLK